jgi:hypothetical protein
MLSHCIFCHSPFPNNRRLQHLPIGRRIAFDPARGRLWCICESCRSWTLAPFEQRWEALEELERLARTRAKLLRQGENIALFRVDTLELIRIGQAGLREEAWWRYGDELTRRRERARKVVTRGKWIDAAIWLAITGIPIWGFSKPEEWIDKARHKSFGRWAWRGSAPCTRCGYSVSAMGFRDRGHLQIFDGQEMSLRLPCPKCKQGGGSVIYGSEAVYTLRRVLAYHNFAGASSEDVDRAARLVTDATAIGNLTRRLTNGSNAIGALDSTTALTLEIALNDQHERGLLALELSELEARWREEETIAAIVDGELTR